MAVLESTAQESGRALPAAPPKPMRLRDLPIGAEKWEFSTHALERAQERGFHVSELLAAAAAPEQTRPGKKPNCTENIRGRVLAVCDNYDYKIVTVYSAYSDDTDAEVPLCDSALVPPELAAEPELPAGAVKGPLAVRPRKLQNLLDRTARGGLRSAVTCRSEEAEQLFPVPAPPPPPPAAPGPVLAAIRQRVLPQLRRRPGQWATLDCNVPGVATMLNNEPGIRVKEIGGVLRVVYLGSPN